MASDYTYFFKDENPILSNWHMSEFTDDSGNKFHSNEQYMMWRKAVLMGDEIRTYRILYKCKTPRSCKSLGRKVGSFHKPVVPSKAYSLARISSPMHTDPFYASMDTSESNDENSKLGTDPFYASMDTSRSSESNNENPFALTKFGAWSQDLWIQHREQIVKQGLIYKFTQSEECMDALMNTGSSIIAEASPYDKIWGIGITSKQARRGKKWMGLNLLGQLLMEVRDEPIY